MREFTSIGAITSSLLPHGPAAEPFIVFAAGSLRVAMSELALAFTQDASQRPMLVFGASGLLRDRLLAGERADVFASANLEHPRALVGSDHARAVLPFARNTLCVLASPGVVASPRTIVDALVDPAWKLGTSTPGADPSGDYAWVLFDKAELVFPGARSILAGKARKLTGGPHSQRPAGARNVYATLVESGEADLFLTYRTNAALACRENPSLQTIDLPPELAVAAVYGIVVLPGASHAADAFVRFVLTADGQAILRRHGFDAPTQASS
jgi:ABC-type molybdate transport system substrate-binding protein